METIASTLVGYRASLALARSNGEQALVRKLEQMIEELDAFQERHPEVLAAPSAFEASP